ncbi:MAG: hypothetical protein WB699_11775 [Bacteroidota bacterium]
MKPSEEKGFLDLASYKKVDMPSKLHGNIIKAAHVSAVGAQKVGILAETKDDPMVILHKDGDRVTSAEFICKCGRSATLHLEYEQE